MPKIEYFYAAHSGFAYLGSKRFMEIASGHEIIHRPVDLGQVINAARANNFRQRSQGHRDYFFGREIERWAEFRNVPIIDYRPTHHDNDMALANGTLISGIEQGHNIDELAHTMLEAHWRDDADLADVNTLTKLIQSANLDPQPLLEAALSDEIQSIYRANTSEAIQRTVFGSPTYFVDGDMFYGQDRLDFIERALQKPFAGRWPRN